MKKNSKIHLRIDTESLEKIRKDADRLNLSASQLCRQRLSDNNQLSRIEDMLVEISRIVKYSPKFTREVKNGNKIA